MVSHGDLSVGVARPARFAGTLEPADPFDKAPRGDQVPKFTGLRTAEDLTYVAYLNGEFELYDNAKDPRQLRNRYDTTDGTVQAKLAAWLQALDGASGEALRRAEERPPKLLP
jgi:hypothetical protein